MSTKATGKSFDFEFLYTAVMVLPFLGGLSRLFLLFFSAAVLSVVLIVAAKKNGGLIIYRNLYTLFSLVMIASAFIAFLTGVTRGTAFYGMLRIVALCFFVILFMQLSPDEPKVMFKLLPGASCIMISLCAVLYIFPGTRGLISSAGRLGGFFQYANTMALYIILAFIVLLYSDAKRDKKFYGQTAVLLAGLLWTGSRMSIILFFAVMIYYGISRKKYKSIGILIAVIVAVIVASYLALGQYAVFSRLLTIAGHNSTFWGRILYWKDSLWVFRTHPFGLGYGGYARVQQAIQTGVYTSFFVHNDYLQIGLDHGLFAMVAFAVMMILAFVSALMKKDELRCLLLFLFAVHAGWDFDLQYYVITAMLFMLFDWHGGQKIHLSSKVVMPVAAVAALLFVWTGTSQALLSAGEQAASFYIYPWDSVCEEQLMYMTDDEDEKLWHVEHILDMDPCSAGAWRTRAYIASSYRDYEAMAGAMDEFLALKKYDKTAYDDMKELCDAAADRLEKEGYKDDADIIRGYKDDIEAKKEDVLTHTDPIAYRLKDKPEL